MNNDEINVTPILRREAKSGRVSYNANPTILYESSKTRISFVPFYIHRSHGNELALKIQSYRKREAPFDWVLDESRSISLNESACRSLLKSLKEHFAVAQQKGDGDYIAIPVTNGVADVAGMDPNVVASAVVDILSKKDIVQHLVTKNLGLELVSALRGAMRIRELQAAIEELKGHLKLGKNEEAIYQEWCKKHSWAFGNYYVLPDNVRQISPGDEVDFLLPSVMAGFRDLIELKRPDMEVLVYDKAHRNYYFSAEVSKAIGQCHRYLDVLHEVASNGLRDHPEVIAYHPRSTVVIGRSIGWNDDKVRALHGLNSRLNGITVMTFDHLIQQGERLLSVLSENSSENSEDEAFLDVPEFETLDEDIF